MIVGLVQFTIVLVLARQFAILNSDMWMLVAEDDHRNPVYSANIPSYDPQYLGIHRPWNAEHYPVMNWSYSTLFFVMLEEEGDRLLTFAIGAGNREVSVQTLALN